MTTYKGTLIRLISFFLFFKIYLFLLKTNYCTIFFSFSFLFKIYNIVLVFPYIKMNLHRCTCVPYPEPSFLLPPHTISLGRPSEPAPSIQYRIVVGFAIHWHESQADFLPETLQARWEWHDIFNVMKRKKLTARSTLCSKTLLQIWWRNQKHSR